MKAEGGTGHLSAIIEQIRPAVEQARDLPGNLVDNAAKIHTPRVAARLRSSKPILQERFRSETLDVVAAFYALETGRVEILRDSAR